MVGIKVNTHEFGNKEFSSDDVVKFCQEFDVRRLSISLIIILS